MSVQPRVWSRLVVAPTEFYATTAQIIPVMLLLFAVQNRETLVARVTSNQTDTDVLFGLSLIIIALLVGESAALAGLLGVEQSWFVPVILVALGLSVEVLVNPYVNASRGTLYRGAKEDSQYWSVRGNRITTYVTLALSYLTQYSPGFLTVVSLLFWLLRA